MELNSDAIGLWPDRRPIGILWLVERQFVSADNEHGIAPNWAKRITNSIKNCRLIGAQGCYIHGGFTAKFYTSQPEWQNPLPLPDVWKDRIKWIGELFREAGLAFGATLKPYRPSGGVDFVNDHTHYQGERPLDGVELRSELGRQIGWCREQDMTLFYLDSPRHDLAYSWFNKLYPDCLLMPEITSGGGRTDPKELGKFTVGFPWSKAGGHDTLRKQGKFTVFPVDHLKDIPSLANQTDKQIKVRILDNIVGGDIPAPLIWWLKGSPGQRLLLEVQKELGK